MTQLVLKLLLSKEGSDFEVLRRQLEQAELKEREDTGVGFFVDIVVPESAPSLPGCASGLVSTLNADVLGTTYGVGFLIFVKHGRMTMLECYSHAGEILPASLREEDLRFEDLASIQLTRHA